jgi:adenylate cyclase class 2
MRNVECKASDPYPGHSLELCIELGADDHGTIWQRDTYFDVARCRLKLREEQPGGRPHLIQYERADEPQERESRYRIVEVPDAARMRAALAVKVTVTKLRRLFLWRGVRIHLDRVERLGSFVELEAVAQETSDLASERALVAELRDALEIGDDRLVARGYADQLLSQDLHAPGGW